MEIKQIKPMRIQMPIRPNLKKSQKRIKDLMDYIVNGEPKDLDPNSKNFGKPIAEMPRKPSRKATCHFWK